MTDLIPYIQTASIVPIVLETARDNFEAFLENDFELAMAYEACLASAGILWTDEEIAAAAFTRVYGEKVDDLMMAWRWQHILSNPNHPDHGRAWNVYEACERWKAQQVTNPCLVE